jgi:hypothetical protein
MTPQDDPTRAALIRGKVGLTGEPNDGPEPPLTDEEREADAAIDALADSTHVGTGQPDMHEDYPDHARLVAALKALPGVDASDAQTGGQVFVVEAEFGSGGQAVPRSGTRAHGPRQWPRPYHDTDVAEPRLVGQASIQEDRWLFGVEGSTVHDIVFGFNVIPVPGQAPERTALASGLARDLQAIAEACASGIPDVAALPEWVDSLERYAGEGPHVTPRLSWLDQHTQQAPGARCAAVLSKKEAKAYSWSLACEGIPHRIYEGTDGYWHVAVPEAFIGAPVLLVLSWRGSEPRRCNGPATGEPHEPIEAR